MLYFLCKAQDPTGRPAYTEDELRAEASLLVIAGSDTTAASLASIFWCLIRAPRCYQKLVDELQRTFKIVEDVVYGPKLMGCTYLRACIDEDAGVTQEMVAGIRTHFHPFLSGPGSCAGKNIALAEILLFVSRTLLRFDLR